MTMRFLLCFAFLASLLVAVNAQKPCSSRLATAKVNSDFAKPTCDDNGFFKAVQCVGGWCMCVEKIGKYIAPYLVPQEYAQDMNCECARTSKGYLDPCKFNGNYASNCQQGIKTASLSGRNYPNCKSDGKYHPVQRMSKQCYCATPMGLRINARKYTVNGDSECFLMNCECALDEYEAKQRNDPRKFDCAYNGNYKTICSLKAINNTWFVCDGDYSFAAVQCPGYSCFCADKVTGHPLATYTFVKDSDGHRLADCRCARDQARYQEMGIEMNICLPNGNYDTCVAGKKNLVNLPYGARVNTTCDCARNFKAVQCDDDLCYCANLHGRILPEYYAPVADKAKMKCDCARHEDRAIVEYSAVAELSCDTMGNYPMRKSAV